MLKQTNKQNKTKQPPKKTLRPYVDNEWGLTHVPHIVGRVGGTQTSSYGFLRLVLLVGLGGHFLASGCRPPRLSPALAWSTLLLGAWGAPVGECGRDTAGHGHLGQCPAHSLKTGLWHALSWRGDKNISHPKKISICLYISLFFLGSLCGWYFVFISKEV